MVVAQPRTRRRPTARRSSNSAASWTDSLVTVAIGTPRRQATAGRCFSRTAALSLELLRDGVIGALQIHLALICHVWAYDGLFRVVWVELRVTPLARLTATNERHLPV
jgi:hypothetical protein